MENVEKTLRDEIAINMDSTTIPKVESMDVLKEIANKFGLGDVNEDDAMAMIDVTLNYQAFIRYRYADIVLAHRNIDPSIYEQ